MTVLALPIDFVSSIETQLGDQAVAFLDSYRHPPTYGLRLNPAKITLTELRARTGWPLEPIRWCPTGAYIDPRLRSGAHPFHAAGLYYLQEPTAMAVAELADLRPGQLVLDLAAAPGGKSTHIASAIGPSGMLLANDIHPARIKALGENLERWGATNSIITNAIPDQLTSLGPIFDRVIVDAPCSGEGLFRRDPDARAEWSLARVRGSADRQREILSAAIQLVRPGGKLVYSTCTFNQIENEQVVADLIAANADLSLARTVRYWPHEVQGEGHTISILENQAEPTTNWIGHSPPTPYPGPEWSAFAAATFNEDPVDTWGRPITNHNGRLMFQQGHAVDLSNAIPRPGIRVVRNGLWLGDIKPGRFEPSHALALALDPKLACNRLDLTIDQALFWISGEPINAEGKPGWVMITVEGFSLGWGKRTAQTVKDHYPKGLRRRP